MHSNLGNTNAPSAKKRKFSAPEPSQTSGTLDAQITGMLDLVYIRLIKSFNIIINLQAQALCMIPLKLQNNHVRGPINDMVIL